MSSRSKIFAALFLPLTAGTAAAQPVDASAPVAVPSAGGSAAAAVTSGAGANAPGLTAPSLGPGGLGVAPSAPSAPGVAAPSAAAVVPGVSAAPAPANGPDALPSPASSRSSGRPAAPATLPSAPTHAPATAPAARPASAARSSAVDASRTAAAAPAAGASLGGAAKRIDEARAAVGGDELSVSAAFAHVFDAASGAPALRSGGGVAGRAQDVRGAIAQKVGIANTSSPADAPNLYQDAIKTAQDALPAPISDAVAKVVRGFAARKADASLGDLAGAAYQAAAAGAAPETGRLLSAFDKWETLLGAPGKPMVTNAAALKNDVSDLLAKAAAGGSPSAPHVWFTKKNGSYTAVLPGTGVAPVQALAAAFALAPSALAPENALGDAYRAFAADPRAATGAGLIYRARRTLGASVPAAALSAGRFWLRVALEGLWRRIVAFFKGETTYRLAEKSGQDALRRDVSLTATVRAEAASARRALGAERLTVGGLRSAYAALFRAAAAYATLAGDGGPAAAIARGSGDFESAAADMRAGDAWTDARLVSAPGGPLHWAQRLDEEAARAADARFWRARGGAEFVNLGAEHAISVSASALIKTMSGESPAMVALDDRLWARGRGAFGEALLSADLRATASGGSLSLSVAKADAGLSRRLEDVGFNVVADGAGLRATVGSQDFSFDAEEMGLLSAQAMTVALGRDEASGAGGASLRELAAEVRRDPASAARLAAFLDGREAFARAPVMGIVGEYEALAPMSVVVGGKPLLVSALRDPDTGLLAYARAVRANGAPFGAAELRALLRAR